MTPSFLLNMLAVLTWLCQSRQRQSPCTACLQVIYFKRLSNSCFHMCSHAYEHWSTGRAADCASWLSLIFQASKNSWFIGYAWSMKCWWNSQSIEAIVLFMMTLKVLTHALFFWFLWVKYNFFIIRSFFHKYRWQPVKTRSSFKNCFNKRFVTFFVFAFADLDSFNFWVNYSALYYLLNTTWLLFMHSNIYRVRTINKK